MYNEIKNNPAMKRTVNASEILKYPPLKNLFDEASQVGSKELGTVKRVVTEAVMSKKGFKTLSQLLELRRALDKMTPPAAFADTATAVEARTKNLIADSIRNLIAKNAPEVAETIHKQGSFITLQKALKAFEEAKAQQLPTLGFMNMINRMFFNPAVGTRLAELVNYLETNKGVISGAGKGLKSLFIGGVNKNNK
jgi:hypothetical protein